MIIAIVIVVVLALFAVSSYNPLVSWRNRVEEAFSTMDVYLTKRYDLIPNLVETVKGYAKHESETFERVVAARNKAVSAGSIDAKVDAENEMVGAISRLFALTENYPELKANTNFIDLQDQLKVIEGDIANARKFYNATVREYNTKIQVFPQNILANMFGFTKFRLFEVQDEAVRQNVKVQF